MFRLPEVSPEVRAVWGGTQSRPSLQHVIGQRRPGEPEGYRRTTGMDNRQADG